MNSKLRGMFSRWLAVVSAIALMLVLFGTTSGASADDDVATPDAVVASEAPVSVEVAPSEVAGDITPAIEEEVTEEAAGRPAEVEEVDTQAAPVELPVLPDLVQKCTSEGILVTNASDAWFVEVEVLNSEGEVLSYALLHSGDSTLVTEGLKANLYWYSGSEADYVPAEMKLIDCSFEPTPEPVEGDLGVQCVAGDEILLTNNHPSWFTFVIVGYIDAAGNEVPLNYETDVYSGDTESVDATRVPSGATVVYGATWMNLEDEDATSLYYNGSVTCVSPVEPTPDPGDQPTSEPTPSAPATPTAPPAKDADGFVRTAPYTLAGHHLVNGREWFTSCEAYSQTERCRTEIVATTVQYLDGKFVAKTGRVFNNLTYLPYMKRSQWDINPLGHNGQWTAVDGRKWRTECDTSTTGNGGCRSYATAHVVRPNGQGGYEIAVDWVFNNIIMFKR